MNVLLVQPRPRGGIGYRSTIATEPLGLEIVGASLKDHNVRLLDMHTEKNVASAVNQFQPGAAGISCSFTVDVYRALELARTIKAANPGVFVFIGGHHASLNPGDFNDPSVDAVVIGEGETTAPELVKAVENNGDLKQVPGLVLNTGGEQHLTPKRELLQNLDRSPFAGRELTGKYRKKYYLGMRRPIISLETSRGCPYRCNFCSIWRFYRGKVRKMSPERVVEELEHLPPADTLITDDNFLADINRADKIAALIEKKKLPARKYIMQARSDDIVRYPEVIERWSKLGLDNVFIGFEKIDQEGMEQVNKKNTVENNEKALHFLRSKGIGVYASFIVDPCFTRRDFQKLYEYFQKLKISQPQISILTPLPGTELFKEFKDSLTTRNYELFDLFHSVLPTKLPLDDFYREFTNLYKKAYISPYSTLATINWVIKKALSFQLSLKHLRNLAAGGRSTINPLSYLTPQMCPED